MYIRKVTTRKVKEAKYYTYRLVESVRTHNGKIQQQALMNLGSTYHIPEEDWPMLSERIEGILLGQTLLFPLPNHIEHEAQRLANILIKRME